MTVIPLPSRSNVSALYRGPLELPDLSRPFIVTPRASAGFPLSMITPALLCVIIDS